MNTRIKNMKEESPNISPILTKKHEWEWKEIKVLEQQNNGSQMKLYCQIKAAAQVRFQRAAPPVKAFGWYPPTSFFHKKTLPNKGIHQKCPILEKDKKACLSLLSLQIPSPIWCSSQAKEVRVTLQSRMKASKSSQLALYYHEGSKKQVSISPDHVSVWLQIKMIEPIRHFCVSFWSCFSKICVWARACSKVVNSIPVPVPVLVCPFSGIFQHSGELWVPFQKRLD